MKNRKLFKFYLLLFTTILLSSILTFSINATSGCCSHHGGVNCSAGADSDGSVICNDGWKDSSCSYGSMGCELSSRSRNNTSSNNNKNNNSNNKSNNTNTSISKKQSNSFMEKHPYLGILIALFGIFIAPGLLYGLFDKLINLIPDKKKEPQQEIKKTIYTSQSSMICPRCGGRLVKKNGRYGYFYGCENYKTIGCKYTRNMNG